MNPGFLFIKIRDVRYNVSDLAFRKSLQRFHVNVKIDMRDKRRESFRLAVQTFIHHSQCIIVNQPFFDSKRPQEIVLSVYGSVIFLKVPIAVNYSVIFAIPVIISHRFINDDRKREVVIYYLFIFVHIAVYLLILHVRPGCLFSREAPCIC